MQKGTESVLKYGATAQREASCSCFLYWLHYRGYYFDFEGNQKNRTLQLREHDNQKISLYFGWKQSPRPAEAVGCFDTT